MDKKPLISVIIPVYKTPEEYLRSCIESVLKQTIQDFEMILVEDGSPDECGSICDEYARVDKRIIVIHQKNAGPSAARNAGLKIAQGKYLTFLDSDDMLKETAWEIVVALFKKYNVDCVVFGWEDFSADGGKEKHQITESVVAVNAFEATRQIASDNFLCGGGYPWNKMWNADNIRHAYGKIIEFTTEVYTYEDKLWIIETLDKLGSILLIPEILYEYRFLSSSLTQDESGWRHRQFNAYDAYDIIVSKLKDKNKAAYRGAIKFYFYFCFTDLRNLYPYRKDDMERYRKTKKRLWKLSKTIRPGDLPNLKYNLAWIVILFFGWL